jgi:hypothetical protein
MAEKDNMGTLNGKETAVEEFFFVEVFSMFVL